jgi:FMN phosphatase YigB (HAD superfamily)
LTNGNPQQQRNKIACIDWGKIFNDIAFVFADEIKRKPSPESVEFILKKHELDAANVLLIGDDVRRLIDGALGRNGSVVGEGVANQKARE